MGISYLTPVMTGWEWFPEKKGTISGIILGALGCSPFFFGLITLAIVNPKIEHKIEVDGIQVYPKEIGDRVPLMLNVLCICFVVFSVVGIILVKRSK